MRRLALILAVTTALAGCSAVPTDEILYQAAIRDAAVAAAAKVVPLTPLPADGTVTVVRWAGTRDSLACSGDACVFPRAGKTNDDDVIWVTLAPEVRDRCKQWGLSGEALTRRLNQLLGLPSQSSYQRVFIEFSIPAMAMTRPCVGAGTDAQGRPVCQPALGVNWQKADKAQSFAALTMASSYTSKGGYPFTRLGYTYDWGLDAQPDHYGASEFVVTPSSPATVLRQATADEYCR
jgi:hypothetical protein